MSDEFFDNLMFLSMIKELPRGDLLFQLRQDFTYIIKTIENSSLDLSRLERLKLWKTMIMELYHSLTGFDIEGDIQKS